MKLKSILCAALIFLALDTPHAMQKSDVDYLFNQMNNVMNRRDPREVKNFFTYSSKPQARFVKTSYLVDPKDLSKTIDQESIDMSTTEYVDYINNIIQIPKRYAYKATVQTVDLRESEGIAYVSAAIQDGAIIMKTDKDTMLDYQLSVVTAANCNFALRYENGRFYFLAMNCVEKINKMQEMVK